MEANLAEELGPCCCFQELKRVSDGRSDLYNITFKGRQTNVEMPAIHDLFHVMTTGLTFGKLEITHQLVKVVGRHIRKNSCMGIGRRCFV